LTVFEHRRIGLEQEFFLVDERGILSNRADEFLEECREAARAAGRDPGSFAPECARSMVEVNTPPVHSLAELAREYLTSLELALGAGQQLGLRLYPLATYPLRVAPEIREDLHYQLQARTVGRERFAHAGRCAGIHLHLEAPEAIDPPGRGILPGPRSRAGGAAEPLQPGDGPRPRARHPHPLEPLLRRDVTRHCGAYALLPG